jgi:hypothetical protein
MLEDIATLSGGQVISEDLFTEGWGITLENVTLDMLGRAKRARADCGKHHHNRRRWQEGWPPVATQPGLLKKVWF